MKIEKTSRKSNVGFIALSFAVILALVCIVGFFAIPKDKEETASSKNPEDRNYIATTGLDIQKLIDDKMYLYNDNDVSIFAITEQGESKLAFVYKENPTGREKTDTFFIHIFFKNKTLIPTNFYNFTYGAFEEPELIAGDTDDFYVFKKTLVADIFEDNFIPFAEIEFINTGRFTSDLGRSLSVLDVKIPPSKVVSYLKRVKLGDQHTDGNYQVNRIDLFTSQESFTKIKKKRNEAIKDGILFSSDEDFVKGEISVNGAQKIKSEFRLKGDWTDHLNGDNKWSYRIVAKDAKTILGMRKFSIQHPKTRNFHWEWLFNKVIKDEGIIGLRYDFVDFNIHVKGEGTIINEVMALEESFDKILIENNKKREGIILGFDENLFWNDLKQQLYYLDSDITNLKGVDNVIENANIKVYNENKVLSDPKLSKQFNVAKDMLIGLRDGRYKLSEVFDLDKLTDYVALCNLFGGDHSLTWHNLRIYYNPITAKLEPVSFDSNSGKNKTALKDYPFSEGDDVYKKLLIEKLIKFSDQSFIDGIILKHGATLNTISGLVKDEYDYFTFDPSVLEYNSNFIKKNIYTSEIITAGLIEHSSGFLKIEVKNITQFPIEINSLNFKDGKRLDALNKSLSIPAYARRTVTLPLKDAFNNAFVSKKNKKGGFQYPNDVADLRIEAQIVASDFPKKYAINAFGSSQDMDASIAKYRMLEKANYNNLPFASMDTLNKTILLKSGSFTASETIKFPAGYTIHIEPGFSLDLKSNASFISKSRIIAKGTKDNPIRFTSKDSTGGGLFITDVSQESILNYCVFSNLSNPNNELWEVSGAVNFHESDVLITNSQFRDNRCEDGLNIIRSDFSMQDSQFYNTFSDSFDGDFVTGTIKNCQFYNSGNDSIDVSGSILVLENVLIDNPSDKGVSAGEASTLTGSNITVENGEIGIVSKDLSEINFKNVTLNNTRLGFSAFQKKSEYGTASIVIEDISQLNNETDYLIELRSSLVIDGVKMPTVSNKVIDQMYGNEYGKSTK